MGIADELMKLEQLRSSGALTDSEFAQAKTLLLTNPPVAVNSQASQVADSNFAEIRAQNELARIDREWETERRQFLIMNRYGRSFVPTLGRGVMTAVVGGIFGIFWTAIALSITNASPTMAPGSGALSLVGILFPLAGVLFTLFAVGRGVYCAILAQQYTEAFAAYQEKRHNAEVECQSA